MKDTARTPVAIASVIAAALVPTAAVGQTAVATPSRGTDVVYLKERPDAELLVGGLVMFGGTYGVSFAVAHSSELSADDKLYIPLAGPWLDLADRPACGAAGDRPTCDGEDFDRALLVASGVTQGLGVLTFAAGFLFPETTHMRVRVADVDMKVTPVGGATHAGLAAHGQF